MINPDSDIRPRSVEEIGLSSNNELLRELSFRITACKEEATNRAACGAVKLLIGFPCSLSAIAIGAMNSDFLSWISIAGGFIGLSSIPLGASDLNASAQARGEANSLTTVLASHLIAEQSKQI